MTMFSEADRTRAMQLRHHLDQHGIRSLIQSECCVWGLQIPLVDTTPVTDEQRIQTPSPYVLTEGCSSPAQTEGTWSWHGQLAGFGENEDDDLAGTLLRWSAPGTRIGTEAIAEAVAAVTPILRHGARITPAAATAPTGTCEPADALAQHVLTALDQLRHLVHAHRTGTRAGTSGRAAGGRP
jgi:hypothetical protein